MSLTKFAIKLAVKIPKIESFDRYLFIGPHPDDIEIGAGATVAKLSKAGKEIHFLICTDGRFGDGQSNGIKGDKLTALRKEEALKSAMLLGVPTENVHFLYLRDGAGYTEAELLSAMAKEIGVIKPDIIFAPDPMSKSESHKDHLNVGNAAKTLACFAPYAGIMKGNYNAEPADIKAIAYYMTAHPNRYVRTGGFTKLQDDAIFKCHLSQYPEGASDVSTLRLYLKLRSVQYGLRAFSLAGEGFRVYTPTHMHCLPEAE